jgi:hypothetical protein
MKDPAFLFYSSDFLSGISDLTMEERGQFITLLCLQHQKGFLNEKTIRLSVGSVSVDVLSKFKKDEQENFFNERLKIEIEKRNNFTESRRNNGLLGGRPKENKKPKGKPNSKPKNNHMDNHMGNENENENIDIIIDKNNSIAKIEKTEIELLFDEFLKMRVKIKKPATEKAIQLLKKKLNELSGGNEYKAIKIIEQSIVGGWQDFYELKPIQGNEDSKTAKLGKTYYTLLNEIKNESGETTREIQ